MASGGWVAARTFVLVTADILRLPFNHALGHAPGFFIDLRAGMLAGRIPPHGQCGFL